MADATAVVKLDTDAVIEKLRPLIADRLEGLRSEIRDQVLCELAAAGRLLPEGCEHTLRIVIRWVDAEGRLLDEWGTSDVATARRLAARTRPSKAVRGEIRTRESWTSPWSVVEPVEVPGGKSE